MTDIGEEEVNSLYEKLDRDAEEFGYHLNPDVEFTKNLVKALLVNGKRYGYMACPCRLADGVKEEDMDMICPCDYRDPDLDEFGACYCALYVSQEIKEGKNEAEPIPDRRPSKDQRTQTTKEEPATPSAINQTKYPVWRCKVCGYLCARDEPPGQCPICKVGKERFERFI